MCVQKLHWVLNATGPVFLLYGWAKTLLQVLYIIFTLVLSVTVSFDPTTYTVTEGLDNVANLMLIRSGDLTRTVVITVATAAGTAMGMTHHCAATLYTTSQQKIKCFLHVYKNAFL